MVPSVTNFVLRGNNPRLHHRDALGWHPAQVSEEARLDCRWVPDEEYLEFKDRLRQLEEIEEWFRERGYVLHFDAEPEGFIAFVTPAGVRVGSAVAMGAATRQLDAAEEARADFLSSDQTVQLEPAQETNEAQPITPVKAAVSEIPSEVREPLEKVAAEFGWYFSFVVEPDESVRWFVFDRDRKTLLRSGVANTWDDARLAVIEDIYPPSGET
jgi:hypothetical protein